MVWAIFLLGVAGVLSGVRLIAGPTVVGRMVALDIATTVTAAAALFLLAFYYRRIIYGDVDLAYPVICFLDAVALASSRGTSVSTCLPFWSNNGVMGRSAGTYWRKISRCLPWASISCVK